MYRGWPVLFHTTGSVGCPSLDQKGRGFLEPSRRVLHLTKLPMPRSAKPLSAWNGCLALCLMGTEIKNSSGTKLGIAKYRETLVGKCVGSQASKAFRRSCAGGYQAQSLIKIELTDNGVFK